jgi:hypothetical protein
LQKTDERQKILGNAFMKKGGKIISLVIVIGLLSLMVICFLLGVGDSEEVNWHLRFHITDKSDSAISGTHVRIHALGQVTPLNTLFKVDIKRRDIDGVADARGDFQSDVRAYVLDVTFSKNGYLDVEKSFHPGDSNAGEQLKIEMKRSEPQKE